MVVIRASGADGYNPYLYAMDGVDEGVATVVGVSAAYFLRPTVVPAIVMPKMPLAFSSVRVDKIPAVPASARPAISFDLSSWTRSDGAAPYYRDALSGGLMSSQGGEVY